MAKRSQKLSQKLAAFLVPPLAKSLINLIMLTCRINIKGLSTLEEYASKGCILALWHNNLTLGPYFFGHLAPKASYHPVVSNSRDGALLVDIIATFPHGKVIKVPHNARHRALKHIIKAIEEQQATVIITPDGPRGPAYDVKPGIIFAAQKSKAPVIPFHWKASRCWRLPTWDRLAIPKPFSTITFSIEKPLTFENSSESLDDKAQRLAQAIPNIDQLSKA
ncbi:MAG: lysophospholipid acyltransferase family protein [Chlamydiota bacterium]